MHHRYTRCRKPCFIQSSVMRLKIDNILTSAKDENNRKWIARVTVDNLGYITYFPRASNKDEFYYVKGAYEVVTLLAQKCRDRVQGVLDRERIVSEMVVSASLPNVKVAAPSITNEKLHIHI